MDNQDRLYQLALALLPGIGAQIVRSLINHFGNAPSIFLQKSRALTKIPGIGEHIARTLSQVDHYLERAEQEIHFMKREGVQEIFLMDPEYPELLSHCPDAPVILFRKGKLPSTRSTWISIIGTRNPTPKGIQFANRIVGELAENKHDVVIVSGLAYGIDIAAHRAALESGLKTVAVLGHGFHTLYPAIHSRTSEQIVEKGALLSDLFSHNPMDPKNFIRRNRIIAGLSQATLVVESGLKGGATTTAEMANSYNRDVFAIPGRVSDERSKGCNWLIRTHQATLIESVRDLEYFLGLDKGLSKPKVDHPQLFHTLDQEEIIIWEKLAEGPVAVDQLARDTALPVQRISTLVLSMEFKGVIRVLPGKSVSRFDE